MTPKTKRRMPWRKVGHELWTDEAGHGLSGLAIALRVMFEARSTGDDTQLVKGRSMPQTGWMLRESGAPLSVTKIALLVRFPEQDVVSALAELEEEEIIVKSDSGAWGVVGWASRQEDESAERKRQQREREAKRDGGGTASDKSVTSSGQSEETSEEDGDGDGDGDGEKKTGDREPESRAAAAFRLVTTLATLHPPTADQRWKPKNRTHLAAAEALLTTDGDPGWPDEVIDLVTDFSAICAQNREEAKFWLAPRMLDLVPSPQSKSGKSRWETIVSVVGSWRAERRVQEQEAHQRREQGRAAERQRVADRMAELENLARNGEPAFARQLRESGQKSTPVVDHKACLSAAQEAVADARRGGRDPTLEEIERAVRKSQSGGT